MTEDTDILSEAEKLILRLIEKNFDYFNFSRIPERIMSNLQNYVENGEPLGGFLYCIMTNDLFGAVCSADQENIRIIPTYVNYIYNYTPHTCHGSPQAVKAWMQEKHKETQSKGKL
jgi:hypothetical protein